MKSSENMIEEIVAEILENNNKELSTKLIANVLVDVSEGEDIISSLDKNCEILFD